MLKTCSSGVFPGLFLLHIVFAANGMDMAFTAVALLIGLQTIYGPLTVAHRNQGRSPSNLATQFCGGAPVGVWLGLGLWRHGLVNARNDWRRGCIVGRSSRL